MKYLFCMLILGSLTLIGCQGKEDKENAVSGSIIDARKGKTDDPNAGLGTPRGGPPKGVGDPAKPKTNL